MPEEIVSHEHNFAPQIAEYIQSNEALADPVTRRDYLEHMDESDFIDMTQEVAAIIRTGDSTQRQAFDGDNVALMGHEVPDQREKEGLLRETWDTAQAFLKDTSLPDEKALEYAALTVAGGLLFAHPFADGNGRTSRYLSYMIAKGGENAEELQGIWESVSGEWQVAPSGRIVVPSEKEYKGEQPQKIEWEDQMAGEAEDALGGVVTNSIYANQIVREFIESADDHTRELINSCATHDNDGHMVSLNGDKLLEVLVTDPEQGITNAKKLIDTRRHLQAEYVHRYLEGMRSDKMAPLDIIGKLNLRLVTEDHPIYEKMRSRQEAMRQAVGERAVNGSILPRDSAVVEHRGYSRIHTKQFDS